MNRCRAFVKIGLVAAGAGACSEPVAMPEILPDGHTHVAAVVTGAFCTDRQDP